MTGRRRSSSRLLGAACSPRALTSLAARRLGLASDHLPQRFANSDPLHASIHVIWGAAILASSLRGLSITALVRLALVFGVFYTGLAIVGADVHHPLGMQLDRGENVFHLLVGPITLAVGLVRPPCRADGRREAAFAVGAVLAGLRA